MDDQERLYLRFAGKVTGPFTRERLRLMGNVGRLTEIHEVSLDGRSGWMSASDAGLLPVAQYPESGFGASPVSGGFDVVPAGAEQPVPRTVLAPGGFEPAQAGEPTGAPVRWFYLDQSRNRLGPVTLEQLVALIGQGAVERSTQVWSDSLGQWLAAEQTELAGYLPGGHLLPRTALAGTQPGGLPSATQVASQPPLRPAEQRGGGAVPLGYVASVLALVIPPICGVIALVCGIINLANRRTGHGAAQLLLSILCTAGGMAVWALAYLELTK